MTIDDHYIYITSDTPPAWVTWENVDACLKFVLRLKVMYFILEERINVSSMIDRIDDVLLMMKNDCFPVFFKDEKDITSDKILQKLLKPKASKELDQEIIKNLRNAAIALKLMRDKVQHFLKAKAYLTMLNIVQRSLTDNEREIYTNVLLNTLLKQMVQPYIKTLEEDFLIDISQGIFDTAQYYLIEMTGLDRSELKDHILILSVCFTEILEEIEKKVIEMIENLTIERYEVKPGNRIVKPKTII